jgi:hypothetical protein
MAIMRPGPLAGQLSGRVGGVVFSRNRGGDYVRNGPSPTNPQSDYQVAVRNALSVASSYWDDMDDAARQAWRGWAQVNPIQNRLGESIRLQGNASYVSLNARKAFMGHTLSAVTPARSAPTPLLTITPTFDIGAGAFQLAFTATPLLDEFKVWILGCVITNVGVEFVKNRLRHFYTSASAQASPCNIETAFNARFGVPTVGQKIVLLAGVFDNTYGMLSSMLRCDGLVVTT